MASLFRGAAGVARAVAGVGEMIGDGLEAIGLNDPDVEAGVFPQTDRIGSTVAPNVTLVGQSEVRDSEMYDVDVPLRDVSSSVVSETGQLNVQKFLPLEEVTWQASSAVGTSLKDFILPKVLLEKNPIKGLVDYFDFVHSDMQVKLQINPGPTVSGIFACVFVPSGCNFEYKTFMNFPHVMINCAVNTSAVLDIPYLAEMQFREKKNATGQGTLKIFPITKLSTATGSSSTITVSLFVRLVDPKFQCVVPQGSEKDIRICESFAAMFLSNQAYTTAPKLSVAGEVPISDGSVVSSSVYTDFRQALQIPSLLGSFDWTTSSAASTSLYSLNVRADGSASPNTDDTSNIASISRFFALYSGDIVLTFQFSVSKMNQGRLVAVFFPAATAAFTYDKVDNSIMMVMDIGLNSTFQMTLPYVNTGPFRTVGTSHGRIEIFPRTPLVANIAAPSTVSVAVFVSGAPNFKLSVPMMGKYSYTTSSASDVSKVDPSKQFAIAQGFKRDLTMDGDVESNPGPVPVGSIENSSGEPPVAGSTFENMALSTQSAMRSHTNMRDLGYRAMFLKRIELTCATSPPKAMRHQLTLSPYSYFHLYRMFRYRSGDFTLHLTHNFSRNVYFAHSYYLVDMSKAADLSLSIILSMGAVAANPSIPISMRVPYYYLEPFTDTGEFGYLYTWTNTCSPGSIEVSVTFDDNARFAFLQSPSAATAITSTGSQSQSGGWEEPVSVFGLLGVSSSACSERFIADPGARKYQLAKVSQVRSFIASVSPSVPELKQAFASDRNRFISIFSYVSFTIKKDSSDYWIKVGEETMKVWNSQECYDELFGAATQGIGASTQGTVVDDDTPVELLGPEMSANWPGTLNEYCRQENFPFPVYEFYETEKKGFFLGFLRVGTMHENCVVNGKKNARNVLARRLYARLEAKEKPENLPWKHMTPVPFRVFFPTLENLGYSRPEEHKVSIAPNILSWTYFGVEVVGEAAKFSECREKLTVTIIEELNRRLPLAGCGDVESNPGPAFCRLGESQVALKVGHLLFSVYPDVYGMVINRDRICVDVQDYTNQIEIPNDMSTCFNDASRSLVGEILPVSVEIEVNNCTSVDVSIDSARVAVAFLFAYHLHDQCQTQGLVDFVGLDSDKSNAAISFLAAAPGLFSTALKSVVGSLADSAVRCVVRVVLCTIILSQNSSLPTLISVGSILALDAFDFVSGTVDSVERFAETIAESAMAKETVSEGEKKSIIQSLIEPIRYYFSKPPPKTNNKDGVVAEGDLAGSCKKFNVLTTSAKHFEWWFECFRNFIEYLTQHFSPDKAELAKRVLLKDSEVITLLISDVNQLIHEFAIGKHQTSEGSCALRKRWVSISQSVNEYLSISSRVPGNKLQYVLQTCRRSLDAVKVPVEKPSTPIRVDPLAIHIHGIPGQGKSLLVSRLGSLVAELLGNPDVFYHSKSNDFFDNYTGQLVHIWEELLCTREEKDASWVLDMVSSQHVTLPMASLTDKGTYYRGEVVFSTSNGTVGSDVALKYPVAISRRFVSFELRAKSAYLNESGCFDVAGAVSSGSFSSGSCWEISQNGKDWTTLNIVSFVRSIISDVESRHTNHGSMIATMSEDLEMYTNSTGTLDKLNIGTYVKDRLCGGFSFLQEKVAKNMTRRERNAFLLNDTLEKIGSCVPEGKESITDYLKAAAKDIKLDGLKKVDDLVVKKLNVVEVEDFGVELPMFCHEECVEREKSTFYDNAKKLWDKVKPTSICSWMSSLATILQSVSTVLAIGLAIKVWFAQPSEAEARAYSGGRKPIMLDRRNPVPNSVSQGKVPSHSHLNKACVNIRWPSGQSQLGVAIAANRIIATRHNMGSIEEDESIVIETIDGKSLVLSENECQWYCTTDAHGRQTDVAELTFAADLGVLFKDITRHVADVQEGCRGKIILFKPDDGKSIEVRDLTNFSFVDRTHFVSENLKGDVFGQVEYAGYTESGDCGGLVVQLQRGTWKVVAIHNGRHQGSRCGTHFSVGYAIKNLDLDVDTQGVIIDVQPTERVHIQSRSRLRPSPFHGVFEVLKEPAVLSPFDDRLEIEKESIVKENNRKKYTNDVFCVPDDVKDLSFDKVLSCISKVTGISSSTTMEDAITGNFINHVDMTTSAGLKYVKEGLKKENLFSIGDDGTVNITDRFRKDVDYLYDKAMKGGKVETTFSSAVKDELLKLEKISSGESRVIESCEVDFVVAYRMLTQNFYSDIYNSSSTESGIAVGIDPLSQYHDLVRHLSRFQNYLAIDYKKFDGRLSEGTMRWGVEALAQLHESPDAIRAIHEPVVISKIVVLDESWIVRGGMPSGAPCTSMLNTVCNLLMINSVMFDLGLCSDDFTAVCYGDDAIIAYNGNIDNVNVVVPDRFMSMFGALIQPASKNGSDFSVRFSDIDFLKRKFVFDDEYGVFVGVLDLDTIRQSLMWQTSGEFFQDKICSLALELCLHGPDVYDAVRVGCLKRARRGMHFPSFDTMRGVVRRVVLP